MRFKTRTLFVVTALVAIVTYILCMPYLASSKERQALEQLRKNWNVGVESEVRTWGIRQRSLTQRRIIGFNWLSEKFFGRDKLLRHQRLRLSLAEPERASLSPLAAFNKLDVLTIQGSRSASFTIDEETCASIGRMKTLTEFKSEFPISGGLTHWAQLPLRHLRCRANDWDQQEFDAIGKMESLEKLQIHAARFSSDNLRALSQLKQLVYLSIDSNGKDHESAPGDISGLDSIAKLPSLWFLSLRGQIQPDAFAKLGGASVGMLNLTNSSANDSCLPALLQLENLKQVEFGHMQVSVATYDALVKAGIEVKHAGLLGAELDENFLVFNQIHHPVDSIGSSLVAWVDPKEKGVNWELSVKTLVKSRHDWKGISPPRIDSPQFSSERGWEDLAGFKTQMSIPWGDKSLGNLYDGIHYRVNEHEIEFLSRRNDQMHIHWTFKVEGFDPQPLECTLDGQVPFKQVLVSNRSKGVSLDMASQAVGRYFDLADFKEPYYAGRSDSRIVFDRKPDPADPADPFDHPTSER